MLEGLLTGQLPEPVPPGFGTVPEPTPGIDATTTTTGG
jgi:hypothetical protein